MNWDTLVESSSRVDLDVQDLKQGQAFISERLADISEKLAGLGPDLAAASRTEKADHAGTMQALPGGSAKEFQDFLAAKRESRLFVTDYPYFHSARPLADKASGLAITRLFEANAGSLQATLQSISSHVENLARIPRDETDDLTPFWDNPWFPPFDGAALYGLVANTNPERYFEVGSGISTRFARQAIKDLGLRTKIVSIDPHPHNKITGLCDQVIQSRAEDMPDGFWRDLTGRDMLFIDNSHRSFPGSDVTVFFAEIMPALPEGMVFGVHDIFLPHDYPADWNGRFYNEQYLLMTYILGGMGKDELLLPVYWCSQQAHFHALLSKLWSQEALAELRTQGGAFWMRRKASEKKRPAPSVLT